MNSPAPNPQHRKIYSLTKLVRGSGLSFLKMMTTAAIGFFIMPFTVHHLGSEQYGIWATAIAFIGYFTFMDLGLSGAVFTHMAYAFGREDHEEARNIYGAGIVIFGGLAVIVAIATIAIAAGVSVLHYNHSRLLSGVVLILGLATASSFGMRVPFGVLNAGQQFDVTAVAIIVSAILRAVGTVIILEMHHGILGLAWLTVFTAMPSNAYIIWQVHRKYPYLRIFSWPKWHMPTVKKLFSFGAPVLVGKIADKLRLQTDTLTVSFFVGLIAVTHYSVGSTLVAYYMDAIAALVWVIMPVLSMQKSVNDHEGFEKSFFAGSRVSLVTSAFVAFGLIAWSKDFIGRWMGHKFIDAYPVVVILSMAVFLETAQFTSINALYASLHQKAYAAINISEAACNLILSILLVRPFGMIGVAVGTLIPSIVFRGIIQPIVVERLLHISIRKSAWVYLKTGSRCAGCLILPLVITHFLIRPDYPRLVLVGALSLIAYAVPMWWVEFDAIGSNRLLGPLRAARRILLAR